MAKARVHVTLKRGVLDPQGKAVQNALARLGFTGVDSVRQGKYLEIELAEREPEAARAAAAEMCRQLLANTVIEDFTIDVGD